MDPKEESRHPYLVAAPLIGSEETVPPRFDSLPPQSDAYRLENYGFLLVMVEVLTSPLKKYPDSEAVSSLGFPTFPRVPASLLCQPTDLPPSRNRIQAFSMLSAPRGHSVPIETSVDPGFSPSHLWAPRSFKLRLSYPPETLFLRLCSSLFGC